MDTVDDLKKWLEGVSGRALAVMQEKRATKTRSFVSNALEFVRDHYSDADLEIADDDVDYGAELEVTKDEVLVASDKSLLGEVKGKDLESGSSLLHLDVSERGLTWQDADPERNFHLGIDLGTTPETFELTIRYAIE